MLRFAIVLLCLLTMPVRANMGETVAQCVVRYGKPVGYSEAGPTNPFGTLVFTAANYTLIVFLLDGKEVGARVSKQDKSAFSDAEMQNIMNADTAGTPWNSEPSKDSSCIQWGRGDKATAMYDKDNHVLIFTSLAMRNAVQEKPAADSKPSPAPAPTLPKPAPPNAAPTNVAPAPPAAWNKP